MCSFWVYSKVIHLYIYSFIYMSIFKYIFIYINIFIYIHFIYLNIYIYGFPSGSTGKDPSCQCRKYKRRGFNLWVRKIPWRRKWLSTPVFLPGKFYEQRILAGCSPWGHKESDMTACIQCVCIYIYIYIYICMCVCVYIPCHIFSIMVYHRILNIVPYATQWDLVIYFI